MSVEEEEEEWENQRWWGARSQCPPCLPHGHPQHLDLLALGQVLDELGGVRPRRQQADKRHPRRALPPGRAWKILLAMS